MEAIQNFLNGISRGIQTLTRFIVAVYDFLIGFIEDLVYVVKLTAEFVINIPSYFSWLPGTVVSLIVSIFAVVVIYKVLGREG
jgi:hypothetical protein